MKDKRKKSAALKYDREKDIAPKIIASGFGEVAKKIIEIAEQNNIPIYQDEELVNLLVKIEIGNYIPEELYKIVAQILAWVYELNKRDKEK